MKRSCYETLNRFIRQLSCEYEIKSEVPLFGCPSVPLHIIPETCSFPCLLMLAPSQRQYVDVTKGIDQDQHQNFIHLLSRKVKYQKNSLSVASFLLMRNLLSSFGFMLELQLQRAIYKIMEEKAMSSNEEDTEILRKIIDLPSKFNNEALAVPEVAVTNFLTTRPVKTWQELGFDHVSLCLVFQAEISVLITPSNKIYTASLQVPGVVVGMFNNRLEMPTSIEIDLDTKSLYNALRRQCKIISKHVINAIVGFELLRFRPNSKRSSPKHTLINNVGTKQLPNISDGSSSKTDQTILSSEDGKILWPPMSEEEDIYDTQVTNRDKDCVIEQTSSRKKNCSSKGDTNYGSSSVEAIPPTLLEGNLVNQHHDHPIIDEERNDEFAKQSDHKKKDRSWKRLISSHKKIQG